MKSYRGNVPQKADGWEKIDEIKISDATWLVYEKAQAHSQDWKYYKIVVDGRAAGKANYWLARNITTGQIGYSRDFALMRETRHELHAAVEDILKNYHNITKEDI